ncbi:MAG TPA: CDP-alcohol phosphatidyltransferase family protein [Gemmataceae bacterium]|jgi:phosphatidylglycerophosphate synthase|nr:CDP-alcohol phosphatidyltransferase family protein [Gemmataceae bacterium]
MSAQAKSPAEADRRPIAARSWRVSQIAADWLVRHGVSANGVSVAGMIAGLAAGTALAATAHLDGLPQRLAWLAAAALIVTRLLANMLDGMVAIGSRTSSAVGELYNEVPDRVSDSAALVGLGYAAGGEPVLGVVAALAAVFTAYVRALGKGAGAGQEFIGPFAKQQRMACVIGCAVYCGLATADWLPAPGLPAIVLAVVAIGSLFTALRRVRRISLRLRGAR